MRIHGYYNEKSGNDCVKNSKNKCRLMERQAKKDLCNFSKYYDEKNIYQIVNTENSKQIT